MWCDFALVAMAYLIVKHFLLDFGKLQPPWMFLNKGTYGHPGGIMHALIQALGSLPIFLWSMTWAHWPNQWGLLAILFVGETFVHYHMDWFKMWVSRKRGWSGYIKTTTDYDFDTTKPQIPPHLAIYSNTWFTMLGLDQLVHSLTYVAMVWIWVR